MPLDQSSATARLARQIRQTEVSLANSLAETTALMHTAAMARSDVSGAPFAQTQEALLRMNKMIAGLLAVQGDAARAHGQLVEINREMAGPETPEDCPELETFTGAELKPLAA